MDHKNNEKELNSEKAICPQSRDFSRWYTDVVAAADLAEHAPVRGSMIIKPYGYSLWEMIQSALDKMIKELSVPNAYFPLFIPEGFLKKESDHVEGFSPELAVVTHAGGKKLQEPLCVRPTSETIIYDSFSRWIQSYRDLPFLINQWSNVVRWELRPRLFLRTTEFLWQEGHTVHRDGRESEAYALNILHNLYKKFVEDYLAIPVIAGVKSESEKFAGAYRTYCIESLMKDGKSLQTATSHDLGDHFAKSFAVMYSDEKGAKKYVSQTSWGLSTRVIGGLIMSHGDDKGLIVPPKIAPLQAVVIPINQDKKVLKAAEGIRERLADYRVKVDSRDLRPGEKFFEWEKKGVPVRIEVGPRDLENNSCVLARRDKGQKEACFLDELDSRFGFLLDDIQKDLYDAALSRRDSSDQKVDSWKELGKALERGGYVYAFWCGDKKCEAKIKEEYQAVTRCLRFDQSEEGGENVCVCCARPAGKKRWVFAKAY
jgi:prolyl-tRNA synthetase